MPERVFAITQPMINRRNGATFCAVHNCCEDAARNKGCTMYGRLIKIAARKPEYVYLFSRSCFACRLLLDWRALGINEQKCCKRLVVRSGRSSGESRCQEIFVERVSFAHNLAPTRELNMHLSSHPLGRINNSFAGTIRIVPLCAIPCTNCDRRAVSNFFLFSPALAPGTNESSRAARAN